MTWGRRRLTHEQHRRLRLVREELRRAWKPIMAASVLMLGVAVVVLVAPIGPPRLTGFIAGGLMASWFWMLYATTLIRTYPASMGEWGESFTRELVASRGFGWPMIDDLQFEGYNVDHVAVSPRAVLAIETKFVGAGGDWQRNSNRQAHLRQALRGARSVRSILRSRGIANVTVEPVLVLWGPGAPKGDRGWIVLDEVAVVRGAAPEQWRQRCNRGPITDDRARDVMVALGAFRSMRDAHEAERPKGR
ncbi:MAG: nuclease-related domain-containing protein [Knoellia sp.]